jgi:hypothetical protein
MSKRSTKDPAAAPDQPKRKRGRPAKAPKTDALTTPPAPISTTDAIAKQLEAVKAKAAAGKTLANHEQRILRDAWLLDLSQYLWPSSAMAAADLGVSIGTFRGYKDKGCPGIEDHSPIPKHQVLGWLLRTAHDRGGDAPTTAQDLEAVELRLKLTKAVKAEGELISEAEDRATQGVIRTMGQLRTHLQNTVPALLYELAHKHPTDRTAGEEAITAAIEVEIRRFQPDAKRTVPGAQTAPATATEPTP